jgi:hypothetical protein
LRQTRITPPFSFYMRKELALIANRFKELKRTKIQSSSEFILMASQIQELSKLLVGSFAVSFYDQFKNTEFFKNFLELKDSYSRVTAPYIFGLSESEVILYKQDRELFRSSLLNSQQLLDFLASDSDNLTEDELILAELFISNENNFSILNYTICSLNFNNI